MMPVIDIHAETLIGNISKATHRTPNDIPIAQHYPVSSTPFICFQVAKV
jgi:hypothetical protein